MTLIAVHGGLHQIGTLAAAGVIHGLLHGLIDLRGVRAVHEGVGHAVGPGTGGQMGRVGDPVDLGGHTVAVVLNEPHHGQLPCSGHVQGLVEAALVGGAVAEAANGHSTVTQDLGGQCASRGDGLAAAHDAVGAQMIHLLHVRNVHGAALALAVAGLFAEQLGHSQLGVSAPGNGVAVAAVGGGKVVLGADSGESAGLSSLLTDAQMDIACQHTLGEALGGLLLEGTDAHHRAIELQKLLFAVHFLFLFSQCSHTFLLSVRHACFGANRGTSSSSSNFLPMTRPPISAMTTSTVSSTFVPSTRCPPWALPYRSLRLM